MNSHIFTHLKIGQLCQYVHVRHKTKRIVHNDRVHLG